MAWIRACGGGSNATKKKFLYKDGVQSVAWDNSGNYSLTSGWTSQGGFTLTERYMQVPTVSSGTYNREIVTSGTIDLSKYKKITVLYNDSFTKSVDISSRNESAYIMLVQLNGNSWFRIYVISQKNNFDNHYYAYGGLEYVSNFKINQVWLEEKDM